MTLKGQTLARPHYKQMWQDAEAALTQATAQVLDIAEGGKLAMEALATERAANKRHRRIELALGVLDIALAAAMLYLLSTR